MTAEIAVLNKSAVALATDSAVTIGRGASAKIYNTVNKIFELHETAPVGIMIYGRLDFMGLPIETVIKQYRRQLGKTVFGKIADYRDDFINWLSRNVVSTIDDENQIVQMVAIDIISKINDRIDRRIFDEIVKNGKYYKSKDNSIASQIIKSETEAISASQKMDYCNRSYCRKLEQDFGKEIDKSIFTFVNKVNPTDQTKKLLHKTVIEFLVRKQLSAYRTGVVIAGFGENEICPSLEGFEMEGIISGKLKHLPGKSVDIGRRGPHADVIGFAQSDMIDRFLHGVDTDMYEYAKSMLMDSITETAKEIVAAFTNVTVSAVSLPVTVQAVLDKIKADQALNLDHYRDKYYSKPILDMIRHMPKQELATLAKALIDLTSLKRKVSREQESVGGEVDVAVISKSEGFVWVKRKHYFPSEINPRFSARHYKNIP